MNARSAVDLAICCIQTAIRPDYLSQVRSLLSDDDALSEVGMLIIDVGLKGMSGFELFTILKQRAGLPPVIFISADLEETTLWYAIALGAVTFCESRLMLIRC